MELTPKQFEILLCEFCKQDLPPDLSDLSPHRKARICYPCPQKQENNCDEIVSFLAMTFKHDYGCDN